MSAFADYLADPITHPATILTIPQVRRSLAAIEALWEATICGTPHIPLPLKRPLIARSI